LYLVAISLADPALSKTWLVICPES
jgi:hypothetical protein